MAWKVGLVRTQILETGCNNSRKGFTIVEILVVLIIISIATSLLIINLTAVSSVQKQKTSFMKTFNFLTEESIVTGNIIGWYANASNDASYFLDKNNTPSLKSIEGQPSHWNELGAFEKVFKSFDGSVYNFDLEDANLPLIIFYPSGENSGGIINIYFNDEIQEITINYNGTIENKIIKD